MSANLHEFEKLLRARAKGWSEVMEEQPNPGLRAVVVGGDIIRAALVVALVLFVLATLGVGGKYNLVAAGLAFCVLSVLAGKVI